VKNDQNSPKKSTFQKICKILSEIFLLTLGSGRHFLCLNFSNVFVDFSTGFEHTHYFRFDYSAFSVFPLFKFANDASKLLPIPQNMRGEITFLTIPSWWT